MFSEKIKLTLNKVPAAAHLGNEERAVEDNISIVID